MSQSASQANIFYKEVSKLKKLWTIRDSGGFPSPKNSDEERAQPFWSSLERAKHILNSVPAYQSFEIVELDWPVFVERWIPGLTKDKILVGVNWSGESARGYDIEPKEIKINVESNV
jgi:hypothetical protein